MRDPCDDIAPHVAVGVEFGLLGQESDANALGGPCLAGEFELEAGHDPQQRRLAGAVRSEDADLGAGQKRERDVLEHLTPRPKGLRKP